MPKYLAIKPPPAGQTVRYTKGDIDFVDPDEPTINSDEVLGPITVLDADYNRKYAIKRFGRPAGVSSAEDILTVYGGTGNSQQPIEED